MLIKVKLITSSYESGVISITIYYINNYDFFFIKKNSSITLPEYRYLKEKKFPPNSFKY